MEDNLDTYGENGEVSADQRRTEPPCINGTAHGSLFLTQDRLGFVSRVSQSPIQVFKN